MNLTQFGFDIFGLNHINNSIVYRLTEKYYPVNGILPQYFSITVSHYPHSEQPHKAYFVAYGHLFDTSICEYFESIEHIDWQAVADVVNSDLTSEAKTLAVGKIISGEK